MTYPGFSHVWLIPLLPFAGFLFQVFIGRKLPKFVVSIVSCGVVLVSALVGWALFFQLLGMEPEHRRIEAPLMKWIHVPGLEGGVLSAVADHKLLVDPLTAVMILVVTNVGFLIHLYSTGYMAEEKRYARYFSFLNLFTGFMLILVMASNLLLMFVGWEGVGLCSYLLIGFWFEKKENAVAGMKAFIVNRIGDLAFTVGVLLLFVTLGTKAGVWTLDFLEIRKAVEANPGAVSGLAGWICFLLFIGATGKSAQFPLYTWLPDAMAGPTPVSALIHAATMVTAGVYMVARMNFLFVQSPTAMAIVAGVGAFTALFAGTIGIAQNDIKKVLAYSTVSQLGFMFLGVGVGGFAAGVFHLFTHAFFKACLFLGSGSVIHGMGGEQDIRKMGGLKDRMPWTYLTFLVATLAIAGFPFMAGFFSKDEILWLAWSTHAFPNWLGKLYWLAGAAAAACTAFYMIRLLVKTFLAPPQWAQATAHSGGGVPHDEGHGHDSGPAKPEGHDAGHGHGGGHPAGQPHESLPSMLIPLFVLAGGSLVMGVLGTPWFHPFTDWLQPVVNEKHESPGFMTHLLMLVSAGIGLAGMGYALLVYSKKKGRPAEDFVRRNPELYDAVLNKYRVDEFYDRAVVQKVLALNEAAGRFDNEVIDGAVNLTGRGSAGLSKGTGYFDNEVVDAAVNASARATQAAGRKVRRMQTGNIREYLATALVGGLFIIAAFCVWLTRERSLKFLQDLKRSIFGG